MSSIATASGVALPASHVFAPHPLFSWYMAQTGSGLPAFASQPLSQKALETLDGASGYSILGLEYVANDNLTTSGGHATLLVGSMAEGLTVFESEPVISVYPETFASSLSAAVTYKEYAAFSVNYADAFVVLEGSAYPTSPAFV